MIPEDCKLSTKNTRLKHTTENPLVVVMLLTWAHHFQTILYCKKHTTEGSRSQYFNHSSISDLLNNRHYHLGIWKTNRLAFLKYIDPAIECQIIGRLNLSRLWKMSTELSVLSQGFWDVHGSYKVTRPRISGTTTPKIKNRTWIYYHNRELVINTKSTHLLISQKCNHKVWTQPLLFSKGQWCSQWDTFVA